MSRRLLYIHVLPVDIRAANSVQVLSMCQAFAELGVDVTLAVPQGEEERSMGEYKDAIKNKMGVAPLFDVITFKQRTFFGKFKMLASYFPAKALLAEFKPDLVFLRNVVLVDAAISNNIPFVYESHNSLMHESSAVLNKLWTRYIVRVSQNPLMKQFVAISGALGKFWVDQGIPLERLLSVHDGFDEKKFEIPLSKEEAQQILALPASGKTVLYVGSLYSDRGIEDIIYLASQLAEINFLIVGGSEAEKQKYQALAKSQNVHNILFKGSVEHKLVPTYLYSADILLMTWSDAVKTIDYCSPLKLFEYMAAGRLIVGHGFPTIREVLDDGEDAYLADPSSRAELLEKLKMALHNDSPVFATRAREKAFEQYTWRSRAQQILDSIKWSNDA